MDESDGDQLKKLNLSRSLMTIGLLLLMLVTSLSASGLGGYTGTSNRMILDPLAAGTGGITLFNNTSDNAYTQNPAAKAWETGKEFNASLVQLSLDRYLYAVNGGMDLPPTAHLQFGLIAAGTRNIEARDSRGYYAGDLNDSEMTYFLSFSNQFTDRLAFGLTFKLLSKTLSAEEGWLDLQGSGFGAGLGLLYKALPGGTFALALKDWNAAYKWKTQEVFERGGSYQDAFPMSVAYGWQQSLGMLTASIEHDHYFIGEDIFRAALMYDGLKGLTLNVGMSYDDETILPGLSARYDLGLRGGSMKLHIDLGLSAGVANEGLRNYLGWGIDF